MPKINMANIQSALSKAKEAAAPLQNKGHTENVPVDFIRLADKNIYNENDSDDSIKELADNIEACGLLHPITVNKISAENYQIISGERRFRAITEHLHWKSIPCMVFDNLSSEAAQLKLCMANLAVREYTASQKYKFYLEVKALLEKMKASGEYKGGLQKGIAEILNVTERQVKKYYTIEKLSDETQQAVIDGKISINKAVEMASGKSSAVSDNNSDLLSQILDTLSDEQRNLLLSGKIDLSRLIVLQSSDAPKGEPVPLLEREIGSDTSDITDSINNTNSNILPDPSKSETEIKNHVSAKQKSLHGDSVLLYKDKKYTPNKIQVLEEHDEYTVFKVFAVKK